MSNSTAAGRSRISNRTIARLVGAGVALVAFLVFVFQNGDTVPIRFFFWEANTRLAWALILAGILGVVIGLIVPRVRRLL
jgi:uncharacterized integral membrane protein